MAIEVGIFLFGHQADDAKLGYYGKVIHAIGEKRAPYTVFFTGLTLDRIHRHQALLKGAIERYFPQNIDHHNPYDLEIGISTYNHFPVVPLWLELDFFGDYFQLADEQIRWTKEQLWYDFGKNARGFFPPEMIFAPATAHVLKQNWLDYAVIDGTHLNGWEKGQVFHHQGLKLVVRNNEIPLHSPQQFKDAVLRYSDRYGVSRIVVGRDIDEYCTYGMPAEEGIALLCRIADALYADHRVELKPLSSIADGFHHPLNLYELYRQKGISDPWHHTTSWVDGSGLLDWLQGDSANKNTVVNHFLRRYFRSATRSTRIRNEFYPVSGMEFRHPRWASQEWFDNFFNGRMQYLFGELAYQ